MIDQITAFSILLVFQSILFSHIGKSVNEFLKKSKPPLAQKKAFDDWIGDKRLLLIKGVLALVFCFLIWYISFPEAYRIITTSTFEIFNFDVLKTSFVVISFCLLSIMLIMIFWIIKTIKK
jgi:hypothetical protein